MRLALLALGLPALLLATLDAEARPRLRGWSPTPKPSLDPRAPARPTARNKPTSSGTLVIVPAVRSRASTGSAPPAGTNPPFVPPLLPTPATSRPSAARVRAVADPCRRDQLVGAGAGFCQVN